MREFKVIDYGLSYLEDRNTKIMQKLKKGVFSKVG